MMIGFFEGIDSRRGIAWRLADSLTLRQFLGIGLDERTPDHVTISRTRRLRGASRTDQRQDDRRGLDQRWKPTRWALIVLSDNSGPQRGFRTLCRHATKMTGRRNKSRRRRRKRVFGAGS